MKRIGKLVGALLTIVAGIALADSYMSFATAHARPLAASPDDRLGVYSIGDLGLSLATEMPVGMERCPVAVHISRRRKPA